MDDRIATLASMLDKTGDLMVAVDAADLGSPTPCGEYDVRALLEHMAVWVQVFDSTVNGATCPLDPSTARIDGGWAEIFRTSASAIVAGLRADGFDRPMTMTSSPLPGEFVLHMLLMEYVGHGWDLGRAIGAEVPFTDAEATTALRAAEAILAPEHRGTGMFEEEVAVADDATPTERFVAFTGRRPDWAPSTSPA